MKYVIIFFVVFFTGLTPSVRGETVPDLVREFLDTRNLVGVVYFDIGSSVLTPEAKNAIDDIVPQLRKVDLHLTLVRLEGFASPDGDIETNVEISMMRAKAVADYLKDHYKIGSDYYLIGFGADDAPGEKQLVEKMRRVEFAVYANPWEVETLPFKTGRVN